MKYALIVIDCQNDFIKNRSSYSCQMLDGDLTLRIKHLIDFCRTKRIPIVYTQHSIKSDKSNAEMDEPENVRVCIIGTEGWDIISELKPHKNDSIVRKDKYDAFIHTNLAKVLKKIKSDTLILAGVLTNNCVRATVEGAHYRNFKTILISDACGATSYIKHMSHQKIHRITLQDLMGRVYSTRMMKTADLKKKLDPSPLEKL